MADPSFDVHIAPLQIRDETRVLSRGVRSGGRYLLPRQNQHGHKRVGGLTSLAVVS